MNKYLKYLKIAYILVVGFSLSYFFGRFYVSIETGIIESIMSILVNSAIVLKVNELIQPLFKG